MRSRNRTSPALRRAAAAAGLGALLLLAGCRCGAHGRQRGARQSFSWTHTDAGLAWGIRVEPERVAPGESAVVRVSLRNESDQSRFVPQPDAGTVTVRLGGGGVVAAQPGRPDRWVELPAGETLAWTTRVSWASPGTRRVAAVLAARDPSRGFAPLTSPGVSVTVRAASK